jgi:hypothetical protein
MGSYFKRGSRGAAEDAEFELYRYEFSRVEVVWRAKRAEIFLLRVLRGSA